jgi:hypothetical protein
MQSSGASLLTFTLAQKPNSVAFVDIWNMFAAPELQTDRDVVAKVVVTTAYGLDIHQRRFRPDVTLLVLRHPVDTYDSLCKRPYANESGLIDEKFGVLEAVFRAGAACDYTVHYEDFVFSPRNFIDLSNRIGWSIDYEALGFARTPQEIEDCNTRALPDLQDRLKYGIGKFRSDGRRPDRVRFAGPTGARAHLTHLCPSLLDHYLTLRADRAARWNIPTSTALTCSLGPIIHGPLRATNTNERAMHPQHRVHFKNWTRQCSVVDEVVCLCPRSGRGDTQLSVEGLPGRPFNRVRGFVIAPHPSNPGTNVYLRVNDVDGVLLAEQTFILSCCDMRCIDLAFEPRAAAIALTLSVSSSEIVSTAAEARVCFRDMRLDYVVP